MLPVDLSDDYDSVHPWVEVAIVVVGAGSVEREGESCSMSQSRYAGVEIDARIAIGPVRASRSGGVARIRRQTGCHRMGEASCVGPEHRSAGRNSKCAASGAVLESTCCGITAGSVIPNRNGRSRRGGWRGSGENIDAYADNNEDNNYYHGENHRSTLWFR